MECSTEAVKDFNLITLHFDKDKRDEYCVPLESFQVYSLCHAASLLIKHLKLSHEAIILKLEEEEKLICLDYLCQNKEK